MSVVLAFALIGTATWYGTGPGAGHAAAGPELRRALGPGWRGTTVQVCADRCVTVVLDDWCACRDRVIDLSDEDFARLAPLSAGVLRVTVKNLGAVATPPATSTIPQWSGVRPGRLAL